MIIRSASFVMSNTRLEKCPPGKIPEFAFIGRSNVGKSSLINMLVNHKNLAKISSKPGKTQTINHFLINEQWYLVDLPGYGYAGVSRAARSDWGAMIEMYLTKRENLYCTFILIDSRITPQAIDLDFIQWMGEKSLPFCLVFTKTDKLKRNELNRSLESWNKKLTETWEEIPTQIVSSSETKKGREELLEFINQASKAE